MCKYQKGIDKKFPYVHNTSHYDIRVYKAQSRFCTFLAIFTGCDLSRSSYMVTKS